MTTYDTTVHKQDIPLPVVKLNRWTLVTGIALGLILQQPLFTTVLFALLIPSVLFGYEYSPIAFVGRRLFARAILTAEREDRALMRFNNSIALTLLGLAQLAFLGQLPALGWIFAGFVLIAASVALAGFCVGCFLYFQFKINRVRWFGR